MRENLLLKAQKNILWHVIERVARAVGPLCLPPGFCVRIVDVDLVEMDLNAVKTGIRQGSSNLLWAAQTLTS